ncbi:hypothetical protein LCGC14_1402150 [marine sediment metagenome]|uniref:Uncharacterized protein n=1 Tax=marine sediment metagenome TaxID=412755 RepID=A0A0F9JX01_9ZZZZ
MRNNKEYILRDYIIKEKKEILRGKSVESIIQEEINVPEEKCFTLHVVVSPAAYPYDEILNFNPNEFDDIFNHLITRVYNLNNEDEPIIMFDPQGSTIDYSTFLYPIIPNKWISIRKNIRFNNLVIKKDGVILFSSSQNDLINDKVRLNLTILSINLKIFFSQVIPEIYENMNYDKKLNIKIESFGLNDCILQNGDFPEKFKLLREIPSKLNKSYILNLQNPIKISDIIILDIRRLFKF